MREILKYLIHNEREYMETDNAVIYDAVRKFSADKKNLGLGIVSLCTVNAKTLYKWHIVTISISTWKESKSTIRVNTHPR